MVQPHATAAARLHRPAGWPSKARERRGSASWGAQCACDSLRPLEPGAARTNERVQLSAAPEQQQRRLQRGGRQLARSATQRARADCTRRLPGGHRRSTRAASAVRPPMRAPSAHHVRQLDLRAHKVQVMRHQQRRGLPLRSTGGASRTGVVRRGRSGPRGAHVAAALARLRRRGAAGGGARAGAAAAHDGAMQQRPPGAACEAAADGTQRRRAAALMKARASAGDAWIAQGAVRCRRVDWRARKGHRALLHKFGACSALFGPGRAGTAAARPTASPRHTHVR